MFESVVWHFFQLANLGQARVNTIAPPTKATPSCLSLPQVRENGLHPRSFREQYRRELKFTRGARLKFALSSGDHPHWKK
jgi:hypothetical protein